MPTRIKSHCPPAPCQQLQILQFTVSYPAAGTEQASSGLASKLLLLIRVPFVVKSAENDRKTRKMTKSRRNRIRFRRLAFQAVTCPATSDVATRDVIACRITLSLELFCCELRALPALSSLSVGCASGRSLSRRCTTNWASSDPSV